jgi:hypothetical protein
VEMKINVMVSWIVTPCSDEVEYHCFGGPYCFHLQGKMNGTGKGAYIKMCYDFAYHTGPKVHFSRHKSITAKVITLFRVMNYFSLDFIHSFT